MCVCVCVCVCTRAHAQSCVTPWTVASQAPLSMEISRQEYWSGLPFATLIFHYVEYSHFFIHIFFIHLSVHDISVVSMSQLL